MSRIRVGIIGCGLIGEKRAAALGPESVLTAVCDSSRTRREALSAKTGAAVHSTVEGLIAEVDAVVVATTNDQLASLAIRAVAAGKHVLLEKPAARSARELEPLVASAAEAKVVVHVGYNHRFHQSTRKAREILDSGVTGPVMFVRARYGHGGRIGYDREWRADPDVAGGGELLDQGVHLIDLARWYVGAEFVRVQANLGTFFWDMRVEDNAFLTLSTGTGAIAHLHASCTEWKNLFSFEIYTRHAKLHLEGLGGSYGPERLYHYQMRPEMGPPDTVIYEYPGVDDSWRIEWSAFVRAISSGDVAGMNLDDALAVLRVVDAAYAKRA